MMLQRHNMRRREKLLVGNTAGAQETSPRARATARRSGDADDEEDAGGEN
jgi:hypothetical protein